MLCRAILACALVAAQAALSPTSAFAQSALSGEPIRVSRATGVITIDGDLADEAWRTATRVEKWYEANPGDNTEPKVRNVGYLCTATIRANFTISSFPPGCRVAATASCAARTRSWVSRGCPLAGTSSPRRT